MPHDLPTINVDGVETTIHKGSDGWVLSHIRTKPKMRGKGLGSVALKQLTDAADKAGVSIRLTAGIPSEDLPKNPDDWDTQRRGVIAWYEKHGFVRNGENDLGANGPLTGMTREPKARLARLPVTRTGTYTKRIHGVLVHYDIDPGAMYISHLETPEELRGQGRGTRALKAIADLADKHRFAVRLSPYAYGDGERMSQEQLEQWYGKNGFQREEDDYKGVWRREPKAQLSRHSHNTPPNSLLFVSSSTREDSTHTDHTHPDFIRLLHRIRELGHTPTIATGHWADGQEESTVTHVPTENVHRLAARLGHEFNQKSVAWFTPGADGADYLHHLPNDPGSGYRTVLPDGSAYVIDQSPGGMAGTFNSIGGDTRDEARSAYEDVMARLARGGNEYPIINHRTTSPNGIIEIPQVPDSIHRKLANATAPGLQSNSERLNSVRDVFQHWVTEVPEHYPLLEPIMTALSYPQLSSTNRVGGLLVGHNTLGGKAKKSQIITVGTQPPYVSSSNYPTSSRLHITLGATIGKREPAAIISLANDTTSLHRFSTAHKIPPHLWHAMADQLSLSEAFRELGRTVWPKYGVAARLARKTHFYSNRGSRWEYSDEPSELIHEYRSEPSHIYHTLIRLHDRGIRVREPVFAPDALPSEYDRTHNSAVWSRAFSRPNSAGVMQAKELVVQLVNHLLDTVPKSHDSWFIAGALPSHQKLYSKLLERYKDRSPNHRVYRMTDNETDPVYTMGDTHFLVHKDHEDEFLRAVAGHPVAKLARATPESFAEASPTNLKSVNQTWRDNTHLYKETRNPHSERAVGVGLRLLGAPGAIGYRVIHSNNAPAPGIVSTPWMDKAKRLPYSGGDKLPGDIPSDQLAHTLAAEWFMKVTDRHGGNYMASPGKLHSIDYGVAWDGYRDNHIPDITDSAAYQAHGKPLYLPQHLADRFMRAAPHIKRLMNGAMARDNHTPKAIRQANYLFAQRIKHLHGLMMEYRGRPIPLNRLVPG